MAKEKTTPSANAESAVLIVNELCSLLILQVIYCIMGGREIKMEIRHEDLVGAFEQKKKLVSQFTLFDDILSKR